MNQNETETKVKSIKILLDLDDGNGPQVIEERTHNAETMRGFIEDGGEKIEDAADELIDQIYNFASTEIEKYENEDQEDEDEDEDEAKAEDFVKETIQKIEVNSKKIDPQNHPGNGDIVWEGKTSDVDTLNLILDNTGFLEMTCYDEPCNVWVWNLIDEDAPNQFGVIVNGNGNVFVEMI